MTPGALLRGLAAAAVALGAGLGLAWTLPAGPGVIAAGVALALALLVGWLLAPRPWGGGATWRRLLTPDPARPLAPGLLMAVFWTLGAALLSLVALGVAHGFDLDATGWRAATTPEVLRHALLGLLLAALHGVFCLGWGMRDLPGGGRDAASVGHATLLAAGLAALGAAMAGAPLVVVALATVLVAAATAVMAVVVLLGGRAWPLIVGNAFAWTVPMLAIEVPTYAY